MNSLRNALTTLAQDIRIGCRMFGRVKLLAVAVVLTLSLGIGVTAGVFSSLNPIAFRSPVSDDPRSFFGVDTSTHDLTLQEYDALRDQTRSVRELAGWARVNLSNQGPERGLGGPGALVTCNFFSVFTETPALGRLIQPDDCKTSRAVMVLSQRSWREDLGSDPNVIGKTVVFSGQPFTIIGVLAPQWSANYETPFHYSIKAWLAIHPNVTHRITRGQVSWLHLSGRLQPGFSRENAATELQLIDKRFRDDPATFDKKSPGRAKVTITVHDGSVWGSHPEARWPFLLSLALPTLLLFMASFNVATLLLSRAVGRQREMAIRLAVGAGRFRLVRMLLVENTLLAASAAAVSLVLVYWIPSALHGYLNAYDGVASIPPREFFAPDWRVFLYLGLCTVAATLCSGVTPALESLNLRLYNSLAGRQSGGGRHNASRLRSFLVVAQVALSMAPLVAVAMFLRAEARLTDPGFETRDLAEVRLLGPVNPGAAPSYLTSSSVAKILESVPG